MREGPGRPQGGGRIALTFAVVAFLAPVALAAGEAESKGLARCAAIPNDTARLACYDELARRPAAGTTAGGWRWLDDEGDARVELSVRADREIRGSDESFLPVLGFACPEGRFEAFVRTGMPAAQESGTDDKTAILRFDQDPPFTVLLAESDEHDALHFSSPRMVASQLLQHDSLFFQFMPELAPPASVTFDVRGLSEAIPPLLDACGLVIADDGILEPRP